MPYFDRGSRAYWHAAIALLFAGYATFSLLYCVQSLLPEFTKTFGVSPAQSVLSVSVTTATLAVAIFIAGFVSEGWIRHWLMTLSLTASSLLTVIVAFLPNWPALLFVYALEGLALGGVPAVAMAYLAEEVNPDRRVPADDLWRGVDVVEFATHGDCGHRVHDVRIFCRPFGRKRLDRIAGERP